MDDRPAWRLWLTPQLLGLHALVIAALGVCLGLGIWQLGVYDTRQEHERADRRDVPVVPLEQVMGSNDAFAPEANHRPVQIRGAWGAESEQFWVSGREHAGEPGYWLAAPFLVDGAAIVVVRGWTPAAQDPPPLPTGEQSFTVILEPTEASGSGLSAERITDSMRLPMLVNELDHDLYSAFGLNTDPAQAETLALVDPPEHESPWTVGLRNLVYSFQWWVFGGFAVFMWWRMCNDVVRSMRTPDQGATA